MPRANTIRVEFTRTHDNYLVKYLARYCPSKEGRSGHKVYQRLVANEQKRWPWSTHHTWQSWRERYVKHSSEFDAFILNYQAKHDINPTEGRKRAAEPMPIEMLRPSVKRAKLEAEESDPGSEPRTERGAAVQHPSSSSSRPKPTSKVISECPGEPQDAPSQMQPPREPEPTDVRPSSPPRSSTNMNADATKKPTLDLPALQTRHDTLEIPSSSPNQRVPPPTNGKPEPRSPPRAVKCTKERPRSVSDVFASEPSSPSRDPAVVDVGDAPVTETVYPRAPPRVVDSLHGLVLVNRKGHVPCAFPRGEEGGAEEEEEAAAAGEKEKEKEKEKAQWPPTRGHTAKQRTASGPNVEVDAHHAFSQPQPQSQPEAPRESVAMGERERGKPPHPFGHISRTLDGALPNRRIVAAQFSAGLRHGVAPQVEDKQREDMVRNGASPVKRIVPTAPTAPPVPSPDPSSGLILKPIPKVPKFPPPRASTRSPFRPERPGPPPQPQPRPQSRTKAARHPALKRIRRQTIGHGDGNGNRDGNGNEQEYEHRREGPQVPSVDLVALSHSSMSARSHSRSSAGASVPARPSRWSLPAFTHPMPWMFDEPEGAPSAPGSVLGSGSSFRWVAPSPAYGDIWGHKHVRTSSLVGTSTPRFTFTPSPARSVTAVAINTNSNASAPHPNGIPISPSLAPHPHDVPITASHGLASILAHMSANHGLALAVVEAVYTRVGSLREADEVLRGMREAAEGFGEREIKRRIKGRREERLGNGTRREGRNGVGHEARGEQEGESGDGKERGRIQLRYVAASEDGEGSEYSPPETSRAAMWKRQSESESHVEEEEEEEEGQGEKEDRDAEEEEEGRAVEEELREGKDEDGLPEPHHEFSQYVPLAEGNDEVVGEDKDKDDAREEQAVKEALMENMRAQELERKVGRGQYRKDIVRRFV